MPEHIEAVQGGQSSVDGFEEVFIEVVAKTAKGEGFTHSGSSERNADDPYRTTAKNELGPRIPCCIHGRRPTALGGC